MMPSVTGSSKGRAEQLVIMERTKGTLRNNKLDMHNSKYINPPDFKK
jgi:hypothetical protein